MITERSYRWEGILSKTRGIHGTKGNTLTLRVSISRSHNHHKREKSWWLNDLLNRRVILLELLPRIDSCFYEINIHPNNNSITFIKTRQNHTWSWWMLLSLKHELARDPNHKSDHDYFKSCGCFLYLFRRVLGRRRILIVATIFSPSICQI